MHDRISVNAVCFPDATLSVAADYWKRLGARRVSLPEAMLADVEAARSVLADGPYALETTVHIFFGYRPLVRDMAVWEHERARLNRTIDAVAALGGRSVYMLTGGHGSMTWEQAAECFAEAVAPCVAHARSVGVGLMTEPASTLYADSHIAHTLGETLAVAEIADIGVCIDLFSCWTERGLKQTIERAMPHCGLVQVCDYVCGDRAIPARAVPGDGDIPVRRILGWILDAGYQGAFDFEMMGPRIAQEGYVEAFKRAGEVTSQMLAELGA
jgi:sugar phosphate isomerase/epimerase